MYSREMHRKRSKFLMSLLSILHYHGSFHHTCSWDDVVTDDCDAGCRAHSIRSEMARMLDKVVHLNHISFTSLTMCHGNRLKLPTCDNVDQVTCYECLEILEFRL